MRLTDQFFENEYRIRFSDIGEKGTLRPGALLDYLQDVSMVHSGYVGYDSDYFVREGKAWAISFWHIAIHELPRENQIMLLRTWDRQHKRIQAHREIIIADEEGKEHGYAYGRFVWMDTEKRRPAKLDADFMKAYYFAGEKGFRDEEAPTVFAIPEDTPQRTERFRVERSDIDPSGHVNNARYLHWAEDFLSDAAYYDHALCDVKIMYRNECFRGAEILCQCHEKSGAQDSVDTMAVFRDAQQEERVYAAVAMHWEKMA